MKKAIEKITYLLQEGTSPFQRKIENYILTDTTLPNVGFSVFNQYKHTFTYPPKLIYLKQEISEISDKNNCP